MGNYRRRPNVERPLRESPKEDPAEFGAMMARLARRTAKVQVNGSAGRSSAAQGSAGSAPAVAPAPAAAAHCDRGIAQSSRAPDLIPPEVPGANPAPVAALSWIQGADKWTRVTECGRYKILISVTEPAGAARQPIYGYAAWKVCPDWDFSLGSFLSGSEARETCQRFEDSNRDPD